VIRTHFISHKAPDISVRSLYLDTIFLVREMKAFRADDPWAKYSETSTLLRAYFGLNSTYAPQGCKDR
jgi:hypothetical protein